MSSKTERLNREPFRFAYVTRHLNRSGYTCLKALVEAGLEPQAVIVSSKSPSLCNKWTRPFELALYKLSCWFYRCKPLRTLQSEELYARSKGIDVIKFTSLKGKNALTAIQNWNLDLLVVAGGWHERIPLNVLQAPSEGAINVHPSLLPEFRGTSITRWQIFEDVKVSGVTIHRMDENFDSGEHIAQTTIPVSANITPQELFQELSESGSDLLVKVMRSLRNGKRPTLRSNTPKHRYVKYYRKWQWRNDGLLIDAEKPLRSIFCQIRSSTQETFRYPGPTLRLNGKKFIIRQAAMAPKTGATCMNSRQEDMLIADGRQLRWERKGEQEALLITQIQPCTPVFYIRRANRPSHWFKEGQPVWPSRLESLGI